ncbi:MAG: 2-isopropylmalate synthase [Leptospiraceae bacterium]|nr:2-isopropylmalate synthase [Leptospiraceae bacterium]
MQTSIEIMDTTLRDGEQTDGVSFSVFEKMHIARYLLEHLHVDRIEIASARVSEGERQSITEVLEWARSATMAERIEMLGFTDHRASVDWIQSCGGRVINLLTKGSEKHCREQLGKNLTEHLRDIEQTVAYARDQEMTVNVYLEDWSNGYLNSRAYVRELITAVAGLGIRRLFLPDTLGILSPEECYAGISDAVDYAGGVALEFHGHNDYGLAVANCLSAVRAGVSGLHVAVNGLGERAGNSPLEAVVTALHDKLKVKTRIKEKAIMGASRLVETFSGKRIQSNRPIVGQDVYTQTAGIHADGDKKNNLYANPILPERFGRKRVYALGKLAGKASVTNNLRMMGLQLSVEREQALLDRVKELGEKKKNVTADDLPFLIQDMFGAGNARQIEISAARLTTGLHMRPHADIEVRYRDQTWHSRSEGDGGYDAFMNALKKIAPDMGLVLPRLLDYEVRIPPGGKTDALVEAIILWEFENRPKNAETSSAGKLSSRSLESNSVGMEAFIREGRTMRTIGLSPDQNIAAIRATEKMLNALVMADLTLGQD